MSKEKKKYTQPTFDRRLRRLGSLKTGPRQVPDRRMLPHIDARANRALAVHEESERERQVAAVKNSSRRYYTFTLIYTV